MLIDNSNPNVKGSNVNDKRPAHKLATMRKLKGHRLSERDLKELRYHARYIGALVSGNAAKLIRFHKRRKRSEWLCEDNRIITLNGSYGLSYRWG